MKRGIKWLIGIVVLIGVIGGLTFAFIEGRKELAREREREMPIKVPPKVSRAATGENVVTFDAETQKRAALVVEAAAAAEQRPEVKGFGKVLDPSGLVGLHGELLTAETALTNSTAQLQRTRTLFQEDQNASRRTLDGAEAQFRTDEIRVQVTRQRLDLDWGEGIARLGAGERSKLIGRLLNRETALVRVDLLLDGSALPEPPATARIAVVGREDRFFTAKTLSVAPVVNAKVQGQGFLLRVDANDASLRPGAAVTAFLPLPGAALAGVVIPRSAIVRLAGKAWVYVEVAPDKFTRREVPLTHPTEAGWFVKDRFAPGDKLVVAGEQTLLSEELKSQIQVGEEAEGK